MFVIGTHYNIAGTSRHRDHRIWSIKSQAPNHEQRPLGPVDGLRLSSIEDASTTQVPVTIVSMADNLCGPSAPTKGLVGHLDRDRTLQQDRVAGSPASAAGVSCASGLLFFFFVRGMKLTCTVLSINYPRDCQYRCWRCVFRQVHWCLASAQSPAHCHCSSRCQAPTKSQS